MCAKKISDHFSSYRDKRSEFDKKPDLIKDILSDGEKRAKQVAQETMEEVRDAMKIG